MKFDKDKLKDLLAESDVKTTEDLQVFMRDMMKEVIETLYEDELEVPRDRLSTFSPEIVKKRQTGISSIEAKVISMYAKGMSNRDIKEHIFDIYGHELSPETVSVTTDKISPTG